MRKFVILSGVVFAVAAFYVGCGEDGTGPGEGDAGYVPNKDGSTWTYNVTDESGGRATYTLVETINGTREVKGVTCQVLESRNPDLPEDLDRTFFKDNETDTVDLWGGETVVGGNVTDTNLFDTGLPFIKYPFTVGKTWDVYSGVNEKPSDLPFVDFEGDDLDLDGKDDTVDCSISARISTQENITVPAGTFEGCYKIIYTLDFTFHFTTWGEIDFDATNTVWSKPYVGSIKEYLYGDLPWPMEDVEVTHELVSYNLPS